MSYVLSIFIASERPLLRSLVINLLGKNYKIISRLVVKHVQHAASV